MKKLLLSAFAVCAFAFTTNAQEVSFGATVGFTSAMSKNEGGNISETDSESGFYIGGLADFTISDKFHVQPELAYSAVKDFNSIVLPIMAKYYVTEQLNVQAGPTVNYILEDTGDDFSKLGLLLSAGAGYDINENFLVQARYGLQLNNYYTGDLDYSTKINILTVGVGYKF